MELKNLMEDEVFFAIDRLLKERKDMCSCKKCKLDIAAIALNNLKPKYVVTEKGKLYGKVDTMAVQFDADLTKEIIKAMDIVGAEPRHE
ncbi:MAG: late competence development ComFB family protein [Tissierellia bacterium]|nr:late competence development ComFB family protein [Tissierellia bacterium]